MLLSEEPNNTWLYRTVDISGRMILCDFFYGIGGSATIKHRCVTHLCGRNFSGRLAAGSREIKSQKSDIRRECLVSALSNIYSTLNSPFIQPHPPGPSPKEKGVPRTKRIFVISTIFSTFNYTDCSQMSNTLKV